MAGGKAHHVRCNWHGHMHAPQSDAAVMMDRAQAFAALRKVPFTEMRAGVLTAPVREGKPVTAYGIADRLSVPHVGSGPVRQERRRGVPIASKGSGLIVKDGAVALSNAPDEGLLDL